MLWRIFIHNLGWKLGAIALAILLWIVVIGMRAA